MKFVVYFIFLVVCYAEIGEFDHDLANIGQYIASNTKRTYHPYAPSSPDPTTGWDYEVEPAFPTHGYVSLRFFANNRTGSMRTCFRTIGGKACDPPTRLLDIAGYTTRFIDVYFCFTGAEDGPESSDANAIGPVYRDLRFGVYVPRFTPDLGFQDLVYTANGLDLSKYIQSTDVGPPTTFSRLMNVMKAQGGQPYLREISFMEYVHWNPNQNHPGGGDICDPFYYYSYTQDGVIVPSTVVPLSGELNGLIRFNSATVCGGCSPRDDDTSCPKGSDLMQCLYGKSQFVSFMSKCSLVEDFYSVRCTDPQFITDYAAQWKVDGAGNVLTGATHFFQRDVAHKGAAGYMSSLNYSSANTTLNYVAFPSWNEDLSGYFNPDFLGGLNARLYNRHYASIRTLYPFHVIELYKARLTDSTSDNLVQNKWGKDGQDGYIPYWRYLGRGSNDDAIMMNCPVARNPAPGVFNGTACNRDISNGNACNSEIGRCFCDNNWLGIACDIPIPADITSRTSDPLQWLLDVVGRSANQDDSFQICSTAGKFSSQYTVFYLPESPTALRGITLRLCECMPGFEGTPADIKTFMPVYASLFHAAAAERTRSRIPGIFPPDNINYEEWFTPYHSDQFKQDHGPIYDGFDIDYLTTNPPDKSNKNKNKFFYNWAWYILLHQCVIWKQSAVIPPLNFYWDYQSFPFALPGGAENAEYKNTRVIYPWPAISTTNRHHKQGIRCMDYIETDCTTIWNANLNPQAFVCELLTYLRAGPYDQSYDHWATTGIPKARLYGGDDCSPCPDCNRLTSDCITIKGTAPILKWTSEGCKVTTITAPTLYAAHVDFEIFLFGSFNSENPERFAWHSTLDYTLTYGAFQCNSPCVKNDDLFQKTDVGAGNVPVKIGFSASPESFCHQQVETGTTITKQNVCACDVNYCGPTCDTQVCPSVASGKVCGNGTCLLRPGISCGYTSDGLIFPGFCKCDNGWEGAACDSAICPFDDHGQMCSGRGTCDSTARRCMCDDPDTFGGPACNLKACPLGHGLECSGAVVYQSNPPQSVCNRDTGKCECFKTMPFPAFRSTFGLDGWDATDVTVHWQGKWGVACEHDYGEICRDPASKLWCSQTIDSNGNIQLPASRGYAGCYNKTCQNLGADAAGLECRPSCKCTLEYSKSHNCEISICGHDECGIGGNCTYSCTDANSQTMAHCPSTEAITKGLADIRAECSCGVVNGNFYASKVKGDPCDTAASICYTGSTSSPCNQRGDCVWNSTAFVCHCDPGHFGTQCETAPSCLTPLGGPCSNCVHLFGANNPLTCTCPVGYLRDANRACTEERCVKTGGRIAPGNETCNCPRNLLFHAIPDILDKASTQTKLGCRKGCPVNSDVSSVECGAYERVIVNGAAVNRSRCTDLMNNDPIYGDDPRPAPVCNCSFFARDTQKGLNYFISDGNGGCKPKCNPLGLCQSGSCDGAQVDPVTFACSCNPKWRGENCDLLSCNGHMHHTTIDGSGPCVCDTWCRTGDNCEIDICALSGGVCSGNAPNDCDCSANNLLKLNNSLPTRRLCVSACQNGGVLNSDFTQCLCPQPYYGRWCEQKQQCNVQFNGSNCDISLCLNGGTPRPKDQSGCICADAWYQGALCQIDICGASRRMHRSVSGSCVCNTGWTGDSCSDSTCLPGGEPDSVTGYCNCRTGYNRTADNIGCSVVTVECSEHGQTVFRADGTPYCNCEYNYTGTDCSIQACTLPFIVLHKNPVDNRAICGCPPTLYGDQCTESYCSFGSWFNPGTNTTECKCPIGYTLALNGDPITGTKQCVPNPYICDPFGTDNWNSVANHFPCKCKPGFSGDSCNQAVTPASVGGGGGGGGGGISGLEIGGIVGGVVGVALIAGVAYYFCKHMYKAKTKMRHRKKSYSRIRDE